MRDTWNMTPDEARKYILQNWFDGDENVNAFVCGDEEYTAMAIAVEALEATKWHYPANGEYPTEDSSYFVACRSSFEGFDNYTEVCNYKVEQERWINFFGYTNPNVYAWCKLPDPPKEEE